MIHELKDQGLPELGEFSHIQLLERAFLHCREAKSIESEGPWRIWEGGEWSGLKFTQAETGLDKEKARAGLTVPGCWEPEILPLCKSIKQLWKSSEQVRTRNHWKDQQQVVKELGRGGTRL